MVANLDQCHQTHYQDGATLYHLQEDGIYSLTLHLSLLINQKVSGYAQDIPQYHTMQNLGTMGTIRESNQALGVRKACYM